MQKLGIAAGAVVAGVLAYKLFSKKHCCAKKEVKTEEAKYFIGIDLGATNAKAGVVDKEGNLIAHASSRLENYEFEPVVDALVDACKKALVEAHLTFADITAIGVGSPGCIDFDNGVVTKASNFPTWDNVPLAAAIEKKTNVKTFLENDANAAAMAEMWTGYGCSKKNLVMLTLGSGIGGAVIVDGKLVHGGSGWAGEPGHQIYQLDGIPCACGQVGCYEKYASANGLIGLVKMELEKRPEEECSVRNNENLDAEMIVNAAKEGDKICLECLEVTAKALGVCCVNLFRVLDPEVIVFTGGLANAGDILLDKIKENINKYNWTIQDNKCGVFFSKAGSHAGIIGAAAVAKQSIA